jgi:hypothetical protein
VGIDIGRCVFVRQSALEEMQRDNAAQRVALQKAPAKSSFCLQILIYQKALPIGIQCWQFISPPPRPIG